MNAILSMGVGEWWQLAGWTMLHFLWLGTLVGAAAMATRLVLRRAAASVRYAAALGWFVVLAALPMVVAAWVGGFGSGEGGVGKGIRAVDTVRFAVPRAEAKPQAARIVIKDLNAGAAGLASGGSESPIVFVESQSFEQLAASVAQVTVRYLPWLWIVGTPLTFVLLATGVVGAERLRRASRVIDDGPIAEACARLAASLRVGRRVTVAVCERIAAPVLVGIVRPIILLPPAALTGWSPEEIEMVLLHELAHVRRWDNLINLMQRIVESVLFFHPAVWMLSSWVRREREACCDAVVVGRTQRPQAYAEFLVSLAAQFLEPSEPGRPRPRHGASSRGRGRPGSLVSSAMAAGPLRGRIRRILGIDDDPMLVSGKSLAMVMSGLLLVATLVVLNLPTRTLAEQKSGLATEQAEGLTTEDTEGTESDGDESDQRARTMNNLKDLVLGLHNYADSRKSFPPVANFDRDGKPLLSWRVHILPFLGDEEAKLYKAFRLDEPWDSQHNKHLVERMPTVFVNPRIDAQGVTNYLAVAGDECIFTGAPARRGIRFAQVTDGLSRTIALVEANAELAVPWTKPQDWEFDRENPTAGLGSLWKDHWYGARADGSVQRVENSESPDAVGIQFTRAGGERDSLSESAGRAPQEPLEMGGEFGGRYGMAPGEFGDARELGGELGSQPAVPPRKFPSLEEQKLADLAWKRLGLELEPIGAEDLKRVRALGYEGGVKVASVTDRQMGQPLQAKDILVGLHVWPTNSLKDVAEVLHRGDLAELNPLKFYVIRGVQIYDGRAAEPKVNYRVATGRISVNVPAKPQPTLPKVIDAAPVPIPLGASEPATPLPPPAIASDDPTLTQLNRQMIALQTELRLVESQSRGSKEQERIKQQIAALHRQHSEYVRGQRESRPSTAKLPVPTIPNAVVPDAAPYSDTYPEPPLATPEEKAPPVSGESQLRYDGRTFEEWRDAWRNELSTEKRLEAVKALAAFGASGRGKEAAEAIMEAAPQYGLSQWIGVLSSGSDERGEKLLRTMLGAVCGTDRGQSAYQIPRNDSLDVLVAFSRSDDPQRRVIAAIFLSQFTSNQRALDAILELTYDPDSMVRNWAFELHTAVTNSPSKQPIIDYLNQVIKEAKSDDAVSRAKAALKGFEERHKLNERLLEEMGQHNSERGS